MSFQNHFDSLASSQMQSPSVSIQQSQELIVRNGTVTNKHLTYAQIRGVIQIFNHHFPKTGKRMSRDEKKKRWLMYRNKIQQEYGRVITGKLDSEKAYIKRYSRPLDFLKYKLKRAVNLKVEDLPSEADKEYYFEIGGLENVDDLIKQTYDVNYDSVQRMTNNFQNYNENRMKKRRLEMKATQVDPNHNLTHSHNNLRCQNESNIADISLQQIPKMNDHAQIQSISSLPPQLPNARRQLINSRQERKPETNQRVFEALNKVSEKLDAYEQELLDKKKIE